MKTLINIFPPGTRMNRLASMIFSGFRVLRHEGIQSFLAKGMGILRKPSISHMADFPETYGTITFPPCDRPKISIIIPAFNKHLFTYNCLLSILKNTTGTVYEVIVVDDASTDATPVMLASMENLRIITNRENRGFIHACNAGAGTARGEFVYFLNNDTYITENAIPILLDTFVKFPTAGAAGSKLVYPNLKLQEAGGIVWKDASAWNYGKFDDTSRPEYNYVREVDYCSGASLCVRKELFDSIGGFDTRYSPGYWEDSDLCFSIRKTGYKVYYQPASVIIHLEGASAGTSTSSGMKKFQELNKPKFVQKWAGELEKQYENNGENVFLAMDRNKGKRFLVIDQRIPEYDKDAGSFFTYSLLRALVSLGYRVILWPHHLTRIEPYALELQQMGIEVIYGAVNFRKYIRKNGKYFDCAILSRSHISIHYIDFVKKHVPKIIFHDPDFEYLREKRRIELEDGSSRYLEKIREREMYMFLQSDVITTVNEDEANSIRSEIPGKEVIVIPHPVRDICTMTTPFEKRENLLFVGSSHPPNTDAILFFAREIMPILKEKIPSIRLAVVGENHAVRLKELKSSEGITFAGFAKDLLPHFEKARVFVAPMRYGAGVKGKIIEAMSYGLPVVTTSIGAEGLGCRNSEHLLVVDGKKEIAEAIITLYSDRPMWERLSIRSREFAADHFSQDAFRTKIASVTKFL
jgi:GT2 family glycosyltransferase